MITLILFSGFRKILVDISLGSWSCMGLNISVLPHKICAYWPIMWLTHFWHSWSQFFIFAWDVTAGGILRTGVLICLVMSEFVPLSCVGVICPIICFYVGIMFPGWGLMQSHVSATPLCILPVWCPSRGCTGWNSMKINGAGFPHAIDRYDLLFTKQTCFNTSETQHLTVWAISSVFHRFNSLIAKTFYCWVFFIFTSISIHMFLDGWLAISALLIFSSVSSKWEDRCQPKVFWFIIN